MRYQKFGKINVDSKLKVLNKEDVEEIANLFEQEKNNFSLSDTAQVIKQRKEQNENFPPEGYMILRQAPSYGRLFKAIQRQTNKSPAKVHSLILSQDESYDDSNVQEKIKKFMENVPEGAPLFLDKTSKKELKESCGISIGEPLYEVNLVDDQLSKNLQGASKEQFGENTNKEYEKLPEVLEKNYPESPEKFFIVEHAAASHISDEEKKEIEDKHKNISQDVMDREFSKIIAEKVREQYGKEVPIRIVKEVRDLPEEAKYENNVILMDRHQIPQMDKYNEEIRENYQKNGVLLPTYENSTPESRRKKSGEAYENTAESIIRDIEKANNG